MSSRGNPKGFQVNEHVFCENGLSVHLGGLSHQQTSTTTPIHIVRLTMDQCSCTTCVPTANLYSGSKCRTLSRQSSFTEKPLRRKRGALGLSLSLASAVSLGITRNGPG